MLIVGAVESYQFEGVKRYLPFLIIVPFILSFKPIPEINRNTDELVEYIKPYMNDGATVYFCPPHYSLTLAYHYDQEIFKDYKLCEERMIDEGFKSLYNSDDLSVSVESSKIIYIDFDSKLLYPENGVLETLDQTHSFLESKSFEGGFKVYVYLP